MKIPIKIKARQVRAVGRKATRLKERKVKPQKAQPIWQVKPHADHG